MPQSTGPSGRMLGGSRNVVSVADLRLSQRVISMDPEGPRHSVPVQPCTYPRQATSGRRFLPSMQPPGLATIQRSPLSITRAVAVAMESPAGAQSSGSGLWDKRPATNHSTTSLTAAGNVCFSSQVLELASVKLRQSNSLARGNRFDPSGNSSHRLLHSNDSKSFCFVPQF